MKPVYLAYSPDRSVPIRPSRRSRCAAHPPAPIPLADAPLRPTSEALAAVSACNACTSSYAAFELLLALVPLIPRFGHVCAAQSASIAASWTVSRLTDRGAQHCVSSSLMDYNQSANEMIRKKDKNMKTYCGLQHGSASHGSDPRACTQAVLTAPAIVTCLYCPSRSPIRRQPSMLSTDIKMLTCL